MWISEAVKQALDQDKRIYRKGIWENDGIINTLIKPTDSYDTCIIIDFQGGEEYTCCRHWNPTADDLTASDWELWEGNNMATTKISFADYLESMLGRKKAKEILNMTQQERKACPVIISGRQGPTGKSTLRQVLRRHGYWVLEPFEGIEVTLNNELQHPVADFASLVD